MYLSSETEHKTKSGRSCSFVYKTGEFYMIYALIVDPICRDLHAWGDRPASTINFWLGDRNQFI